MGGNCNIHNFINFEEPLEERFINSGYEQVLNELVKGVSEDEVLNDTEVINEEKVFECGEIEERSMPKIGTVTNESVDEVKEVEVSKKGKKKQSVNEEGNSKYKIKTNAFSFTKSSVPLKSMQEVGGNVEDDGMYCFKNVKSGVKGRDVKETGGMKENVKKAVDNAKRCTKDLIGNIIGKFKK